MIQRISKTIRTKYTDIFFMSLFATIAETVLQLIIPLLMSNIIDLGIVSGNRQMIFQQGALMIALALLSLGLGLASARFSAVLGNGVGTELRDAQFRHIQHFSFAQIDRFSTGSLITRMTSDVTAVQQAITMGMRMLVRTPIMIIVAMFLAFSISRELSAVFFYSIPILFAIIGVLLVLVAPRFTRLQKQIDKLNTAIQENLSGIRVVKSFVRADYESEKFDERNQKLWEVTEKASAIMVIAMPLVQMVIFGSTIAILWLGGHAVYRGALPIGKLATFLSYVNQILFSVIMMSVMLIVVSRSAASGKRIAEVLREEEEFDEVQMHGDEVISDGSLSFEEVSFRYHKDGHRNILEDISFRIHSGGTLGIIGRTGSGKSTLVQLIPRLYEVDTGTIRVGGKDIHSVSPVALRDAVSMVLQKNTLFSGTIRENLQWGNEKADDATLMRAAEMAGAAEFIRRFSEGLDTMLEQDGRNLSGGQRQRLTITRALLTEPKILILDDSTSAVDMATERNIQEALETSLPGMTKIIIAQRISSVQNADKILVIEEGKIACEGTHEELIKTCDIYESIYRSQTWEEGANVS